MKRNFNLRKLAFWLLTLAMTSCGLKEGSSNLPYHQDRPISEVINDVKIKSIDGNELHRFGSYVEIAGTHLAVGKFNLDSVHTYSLKDSRWNFAQKLVLPNYQPCSSNKSSIHIKNQTMVISCPPQGLHVYQNTQGRWEYDSLLTPPDASQFPNFGPTDMADENTLVIGSSKADGPNGEAEMGEAWVFEYDGSDWQSTRLRGSAAQAGYEFANSVAMSGNKLMIGTIGDYDNLVDGHVYYFKKIAGAWIEQQIIQDSPSPYNFGRTLDMDGDLALLNAPAEKWIYAYKFDGTSWIKEAIIRNVFSSGVSKLSLSGTKAVLAHSTAGGGGDAKMMEHQNGNWTIPQSIAPAGLEQLDLFGSSVSVFGNHLLVGAPGEDDQGESSGAAYYFNLGN